MGIGAKQYDSRLRKVFKGVEFYCIGCGEIFKQPIYGIVEDTTGKIVKLHDKHSEVFLCEECRKKEEEERNKPEVSTEFVNVRAKDVDEHGNIRKSN